MADDTISFEVNGRSASVSLPATTPLMYVLRNDLGYLGVRTGCSVGECGACRVIIDGESVPSCLTPLSEVAGTSILTPEGLGGPDDPDPVQQAFLDEQAAQCGYCVNGMIMSVRACIDRDSAPDPDTLCEALDEHLCRCGTHHRMLRAARRAAGHDLEPIDLASRPATPTSAPSDPHPVPQAIVDRPRIEDWIELRDDGHVFARPGKVELGQGIRTAFGQIVASQLGIGVDRVHLLVPVTGRAPDQGQTAGSFSIEHGGTALAMAARALRRGITERAASRLGVAAEAIRLGSDGVDADAHHLSYVDLLDDGPITGSIEEDDQPRWDIDGLGEAQHREDLKPKLTGAPAYVQDLALDDMLHARVVLPPTIDAEPEALETDPIREMPGVVEVVRNGNFVVVVAEREEQAIRAANRLRGDTRWKLPTTIDERDTEALLRSLPSQEAVLCRDDDVDGVLASAPRTHSATYSKPYQAHGPMAPSAAVATDDEGTLRIHTHSQGIYPLRRELAALLGRDEATIELEHTDGPGCYGLTCSDDAAAFAAYAALAVPGRPVRFQFPVEDEFAWDPHGPGMVADLTAGLTDDGSIAVWRHRGISDAHSTRANGDGDRLLAAWVGSARAERPWGGLGEPGLRNARPLYDLPAADIANDEVRGPLRTGPLRSLGSFFNTFAIESFVDEMAELAGEDPVAFRLAHLTDERARHVLEVAAEHVGWEPHVGPSGRGLGVAIGRYKDSKGYAAEVAEVTVDTEAGTFEVVRLVAVCDAGAVINPDGLRNQIEGGLLQGLSRTLYEELHLADEGTAERDWTTYGRLRFSEVPDVEVVVLDRPDHPPLGAGEVSTPPVPAAIANALDDALGIRLRALPLTSASLQKRLLDMTEEEMARVRM